jgi:hypothetical protein
MGMLAAFVGASLLALSAPSPLSASRRPDAPRLLREIRAEVVSIGGYPGEDFVRGEFHLGEGDDDTNKTHAVGILVKDEDGGSRLTIVVSRLEPARNDPRIRYARDPKTIVCAFKADAVELVRSDYTAGELEELLPEILKAVLDKKALLKKISAPPLEAAGEFASTFPVRGGDLFSFDDGD